VETLTWKIRIAVLWIFMAVAISAHSVLSFMEPGVVQKILSGELAGPGMMFFMSLFWWVPLVMAFLSVTLKDVANRWANIILGVVFTALNVFHLTEHVLAGPSVHQILIIGSTVVVTALIVWHAWKWPKQKV